jgi:hypothetical protein
VRNGAAVAVEQLERGFAQEAVRERDTDRHRLTDDGGGGVDQKGDGSGERVGHIDGVHTRRGGAGGAR